MHRYVICIETIDKLPDAEAEGLEMDIPGDILEVLDIYILLTVLH